MWLIVPSLICLDGKFWDFTSDLSRGDTAYTTLALGAHTDNTYFVRSIRCYSVQYDLTLFRLIHVAFNSSIFSHIQMVPGAQLF